MAASKPAFFTVLIGDFCRRLKMPTAFVDKLRGTPPCKCVLRGPNGQSWNVALEERESGLFFCKGWRKFVKYHCLEEGDFLVFHYTGKLKFDVTIYDESACEMDLEVSKRRSLADGSSDQVMSGKAVIEETPTGLTVFQSRNSCFMKTLETFRRYDLTIPQKIVKAEGLKGHMSLTLRDPEERSRIVETDVTVDKRLKLTKGWCQGCREFNISIGDKVVFEFVKPNVIQLHIFRGKDVLLSGPKVVDSSNYRQI
ncbi:B3 domain-containing protein REM9 isoform X1 [Rosa chinensis]|nr:B3 domain-containing protein REM9 isoform X1 [Rosa chinensis]XP_040365239.1 B3 domain-containing protein REM9 isoform X1 [Rosa chinensis]XP_040365240.1 B3 domain-containing protein REM9 isoform X1 [Rosa chinensis]